MLLGQILKNAGVSLSVYEIEVELLAEGKTELTYEEMEYVLKDNPDTQVLAENLKEELKTSESFVL